MFARRLLGGGYEERKQEAIVMVMVGSYIDAEQDEQSTATPTFGILHSERRSNNYLR